MNLRFLDLSYNGLRQIEPDAFKGLTKLTDMSLRMWKECKCVHNSCNNLRRDCIKPFRMVQT